MDFVVIGIVIGGFLVACGVVVRDFGPRMKPRGSRSPNPDLTPEQTRSVWRRYCVAAGSLITAGGLIMVLVTVLAIVLNVSDATGMKAVLVSGVIALGCIGLVALVVTPHYRRGGFDPRLPTAEIEESAVIVPAPVLVLGESLERITDDPFEPVPLVATPQSRLDDPLPTFQEVEPTTSATATESSPNVPEVVDDSTTQETGFTTPDEAIPVMQIAPEIQSVESNVIVTNDKSSVQLGGPVAASQMACDRASRASQNSRIGENQTKPTVDDELPAWNAPLPEPEPEPIAPAPTLPAHSTPRRPTQAQTESGFQSSLFSDLGDPQDETQDITGQFKSRLLNELTRAESPKPQPTVDVLVDEFSLPQDPEPDNRGSGNTR